MEAITQVSKVALYTSIFIVGYLLWALYAVTIHPLAGYPGPKLAAITNLYYGKLAFSGKLPQHLKVLHEKYGSVVRIAPHELSFASAAAYKDIYNQTGDKTFVKSKFYKTSNFQSSDIIGESDVQVHAQMRKLWAHGFSARALQEHEELVQQHVNLLVDHIGKYGQALQGINIVDWFNYMTFDIIGELVFGESFGAVAKGASHPWVSVILDNMHASIYIDLMRRFGLSIAFKNVIARLPLEKMEAMSKHCEITRQMAAKRLARGLDWKYGSGEHKDFLAYMIENDDTSSLSNEDLAAQGQNLVIAGSETTATTLSAITYYLLKHADIYQKFREEIRNQFSTYDEITSNKIGPLPMLHAVINEAMRLYPPVPFGPPRLSPGAYVDGRWVPKGTEVSVTPWAISRDPSCFHDPEKFLPERWLDSRCTDNREAFQPFHLGPRVCLGRNLAFIELRLTLAKLHWKYDLELINKDVDLELDSRMYLLWNKPQLKIHVRERKA